MHRAGFAALCTRLPAPARDTGHGNVASHGQERQGDVMQLAQRGCTQTRLEAGEQC